MRSTPIDLRSDTVTKPTEAMRAVMATAEVGDDVYGDDPTVNELQVVTADRLGFEDAMFVPSGTQSNLCALLTHCRRGDEYLAGQTAHTYKYEAGGAAVLGGIQPQPVALHDAMFDLDELAGYIKVDDPHFARTRLLTIENTKDGRPLPHDYLTAVHTFAADHGLATHLDGARLWNAAVADGVEPRQLCAGFDSVSVCFSKGLGAPVGSVLVGSEAFIAQAKRWRKMAGGGMRQAGILAAAARYALDHHVERLAQDHARAATFAQALSETDNIELVAHNTNMVFVRFPRHDPATIAGQLADQGIVMSPGAITRFVLHLGISDDDVTTVTNGLRAIVQKP